MRLRLGGGLIVVALLAAGPTFACSIIPDTRSPFEIRRQSLPVEVGNGCGFRNAGVYDHLSAADAEDLGNGRIAQRLFGEYEVLVADCATREVTILHGEEEPVQDLSASSSQDGFFVGIEGCSQSVILTPVIGPDAVLSVAVGANLTEMVARLTAVGATESNPIERFIMDPWGEPVPAKDQVDLLCGCGLFYPGSPGDAP